MAKWCLIPKEADRFIKGLRSGEIDPFKLAEFPSSEARRAYLAKFVSEANAKQINALFESKLLLKNQQAGYIRWAKRTISNPIIRRDIISKIEGLKNVLRTGEEEAFKADLAAIKIDTVVTQDQAQALATLSKRISDSRIKANLDEVEKFTPIQAAEWMKNPANREAAREYGRRVIALDNYFTQLKQEANKLGLRDLAKDPIGTVKKGVGAALDTSKATSASMDVSAIGNQGFAVLLNYKTIGIWRRNALQSIKALVDTLGGKPVWDEFRADLVSRPNYINGLYKEHKIALNVVEEAFPTSLPEKVPLAGRIYKATETAFNVFQNKNRADIADMFLALAERNGQILRGENKMKGLGLLVNSLTARGSLGKLEPVGNLVNAPFFSLRRAVSQVDALTGYQIGERSGFVRKQGALAVLQQILTIAAVLGTAEAFWPNSVETDSNSSDFGKIKAGDTRFDVTNGMAGYVVLASRLLTGKVKSSTSENVKELNSGEFNSPTYLSIIQDFGGNKFSPALGQLVQVLKGEDRQGNKPTVGGIALGMYTPLGIRNMQEVLNNPNSANFILVGILNGLGIPTNTYPNANIKTQAIPEGAHVTDDSFIDAVNLYAKALKTDPETAFNRIFTGQKIVRVTNDTVMVERMPLKDSQAIKKAQGGNTTSLKLDHTIPLQLGGSNSKDNLKLVPTGTWNTYTSVENALGRALKAEKITKKEAQELIVEFKKGKLTKEAVLKRISN